MNVNVENLGSQHHIVHITLDHADYKEPFEKALKEIGKKAQVPGFRPGHVPAGMIRKMYGESVILDELYKLVNEQMNNWLKTNNHELLGDALPVNKDLGVDYNSNKSYEFSYEVGVQPEVEVESVLRNAAAFTRYRIPATEAEIDQEVERMQRKYGERKDVESIEENDVVYAHAHQLNDDGSEQEGGMHVDTYFNLQMLNDDQKDVFLGAKSGETKNIMDIFSVFKGDKVRVAKNVLQMGEVTEAQLEDFNPAFSFRIDRIARLFDAEINEAFFTEVSKEVGPVTNMDELRNQIRGAIELYNDQMTDVNLENNIFTYLMDTTNVPLPDVFLRKWYVQANRKSEEAEDFEKEFTEFITRLKQSLIYRKVQQTHQIEVSNEEIVQEATATVARSYAQLGDDFIQYVLGSQLKDKQFVENMHDRVAQKKFFAALRGYVAVEEQSITLEAFQEMNKKTEETYAS
ncbi:MAG TPA: trigger factor [Chitinophagales bacterium]|nr:trigger factor [Chitinophagales bacterium]HMU69312.1 trigger factor [Chitinophagales bacterium]HMZ89872.1 trigger factor [Chitinophagales bacterium]HNA58074.1 trigger factor [Chitinophagales bacterium]HNE47081.1 trigger factor [Chitinophagales bacterium]